MENEILDLILDRLDGLKSDFSEFKSDVSELKSDFSELKSDMVNLRELAENTHRAVVLIENDHLPKMQATIDGIVFHQQQLAEHDKRIVQLETVTDRHSLEIAVMKAKQVQ